MKFFTKGILSALVLTALLAQPSFAHSPEIYARVIISVVGLIDIGLAFLAGTLMASALFIRINIGLILSLMAVGLIWGYRSERFLAFGVSFYAYTAILILIIGFLGIKKLFGG